MVQAKHSSLWPADASPSTLLCIRVKGKVDDVFKTLWIHPELAANLHKLRNDTNLVESPWVASREELPQPQFTWEPAAVPARSSTVASDRWRKVRFESPPTALASKPFQNEEVQHCTEHRPGHSHVMYCQANTTAPYGDKFDVAIKCVVLAEDASNSLVHISFHVQWSPAMNRMMKAMIAKAVEAGVRGTYKQYRQVLETLHPCEDVSEAAFSELLAREPSMEALPAAAVPPAVHARAPEPAPALRPPQAVAAMEPTSLLTYAFGQLVWGEQVRVMAGVAGAGMRSAASEGLVARVMAAVVTLSLIHAAVTMLHSVQTFCHAQRHVFWLLCLPITHGVDLPESLSEVLVSLLLVAMINWAIIWGAQASMTYGSKAAATLPASLSAPAPAAGAITQAAAAAATPPGTADLAATSDGTQVQPAGATSPASGSSASANMSATPAVGSTKPPAVPAMHVSKAAPKRADIVPPKGRTPAAVPAAPPPPSLMSGSSRSSTSPTPGTTTASPAITAPPHPITIPKHSTSPKRRGNSPRISFGGTSTQAPLQMEMTSLPPTPKEVISPTGASAAGREQLPIPPPPASKPIPIPLSIPSSTNLNGIGSKVSPSGASAPALASNATSAAVSPATSPHDASLLSDSTPHTTTGGRSMSTTNITTPVQQRDAGADSKQAPVPSSKSGSALDALAAAGSEQVPAPTQADSPEQASQPRKPVGSPDSSGPASTPATTPAGITAPAAASKQGADAPAPPLHSGSKSSSGGAAPSLAPALMKSNSTVGVAASSMPPSPPLSTAGGSGSHTHQVFGAQYPPGSMPPHMMMGNAKDAEPMKAWIKSVSDSMDAFAEGFKGAFGMKLDENGSGSLMGAGGSVASLSGQASPGAAPAQPQQVEEEVYENERFQPFRGWGHTWPGHFLPSDRVGHWSDVSGGPGGTASMIFEQVEPPLPPGYMWVEEEWQLDMEALDREGVDESGWTYALDFNYLKHPPPAGTGKCTLKHFVRRRRWFRTRVRVAPELAPLQVPLMSKEAHEGSLSLSNSPSFDVGVAHIEPHSQHDQHFSVVEEGKRSQAGPAAAVISPASTASTPPAALVLPAAKVPGSEPASDKSSSSSSSSSNGDNAAQSGKRGKQHGKTRLAQSSTTADASKAEDEAPNTTGTSVEDVGEVEASEASLLDPAGGLPAAMSDQSTLKPATDSMASLTGAVVDQGQASSQGSGKAGRSGQASPVNGGNLQGSRGGHAGVVGGPAGKVARRAAGSAALGKALDVALISSVTSADQGHGLLGVGHVGGMGEDQMGGDGGEVDGIPVNMARHRRELSCQSTSSNHPLRPQDSL